MYHWLKSWLFVLSCMLLCRISYAQQVPLGQWQTHACYNASRTVEQVGDELYSAYTSLYNYSLTQDDYQMYSKVNGLSDVEISWIRYDAQTGYLLIVYQDGNIDLLHDHSFYNMPDIRNLNITGSKRINSVYFYQQLFYLCTDFGILLLDPVKKEIRESYVLQQNAQVLQVHALTVYQDSFYAATSNGILVASVQDPALQNFAHWTARSSQESTEVFVHQGHLFFVASDTMYLYQGVTPVMTYAAQAPIQRVRAGAQHLYVCERNDNRRAVMVLDENGVVIDSIFNVNPNDVLETAPGEIWVADEWQGLLRVRSTTDRVTRNPNGIYSNSYYKLSVYQDTVYLCAGGESSWVAALNSGGISKYANGTWSWYNRYVGTPGMDTVIDITDALLDPRTNNLYASSYGGGLLEIHPDGSTNTYKENGYIQSQIGNPGTDIIAGLTMDKAHNLWMSNYSAPAQLVVKKADGSWRNFSFPYPVSEKSAGQLLVDDEGQIWMIAPRGIGLFVLNTQQTIDDPTDDVMRLLTTGAGNGNLPNNNIMSIAKDRNGKIWVGTSDGIAIYNCPESVCTSAGCDAELKIVKYDLNAGLLFQREIVNTIAVDGANNKWIGTDNGVWLISDDAEKIIHRFTKDNSPLPSNEIRSIVIQPHSGEVFIATSEGLVSYRGEATEPAADNLDLLVFPNPVPSGYTGTIAIKNLVENADVRITDEAGQLVYRTKAQGGQAVWNGKNYLGVRPRTGVYFVFITNSDGTEKKAGKFIFRE